MIIRSSEATGNPKRQIKLRIQINGKFNVICSSDNKTSK
jgi:hypothetical protein